MPQFCGGPLKCFQNRIFRNEAGGTGVPLQGKCLETRGVPFYKRGMFPGRKPVDRANVKRRKKSPIAPTIGKEPLLVTGQK